MGVYFGGPFFGGTFFGGSWGSSQSTGNTTITVSGVIVTPGSASVQAGSSLQFQATVMGSPGVSQEVVWGASLGSVNPSGVYTAPGASSISRSDTVTATSVAEVTKIGMSTVAIPSEASTAVPAKPRWYPGLASRKAR